PGSPEHEARRDTPTVLYTSRSIELAVLLLNIAAVHLLLPRTALTWLLRRARGHTRADPPRERMRHVALLVAATVYLYFAGLVNFVETNENMRYRLQVELVIWLITLLCLTELARLVFARTPERGYVAGEARRGTPIARTVSCSRRTASTTFCRCSSVAGGVAAGSTPPARRPAVIAWNVSFQRENMARSVPRGRQRGPKGTAIAMRRFLSDTRTAVCSFDW